MYLVDKNSTKILKVFGLVAYQCNPKLQGSVKLRKGVLLQLFSTWSRVSQANQCEITDEFTMVTQICCRRMLRPNSLIGLLGLNYDDMAMLRWTISAPLIMDGIKYFLGPEALRGRNVGYNFA